MPNRLIFTFLVLVFSCASFHRANGQSDSSRVAETSTSPGPVTTRPADTTKHQGKGIAIIDSCEQVIMTPDAADSGWVQDTVRDCDDTLFDKAVSDLETFVWDSAKINFKRLDSVNWNDTVRIILADPLKNKRYVQPFCGPITSNFGMRTWRWHYGTDVRLMIGDTVRAAFDGIVRIVAYDRHGYGNVIVIRHADGLETLYGHLSKKSVVIQQRVKAGDVIGLGGNTGHSTGSHLHFELRYYGEAFDPAYIVNFDSCKIRHDTLELTKENFAYLVELRKEKWAVIGKGNTLGSIARRYHTTIAKLCTLNHITRKTILRVGRKIRYQ